MNHVPMVTGMDLGEMGGQVVVQLPKVLHGDDPKRVIHRPDQATVNERNDPFN